MKGRWGRWILDAESQSLCLADEVSLRFCHIPLSMCNSSAEILDWIAKIQEKTWANSQDVGDLVEALNDLLDLQRNFCGAGIELSDGYAGYSSRILDNRLALLVSRDRKKGATPG